MQIDCVPLATSYDPAEDLLGSIGQFKTVDIAEQLADTVLQGLTARMCLARKLTFTALASLVDERASARESGGGGMRCESCLDPEHETNQETRKQLAFAFSSPLFPEILVSSALVGEALIFTGSAGT